MVECFRLSAALVKNCYNSQTYYVLLGLCLQNFEVLEKVNNNYSAFSKDSIFIIDKGRDGITWYKNIYMKEHLFWFR